jgi:hypothetical protein
MLVLPGKTNNHLTQENMKKPYRLIAAGITLLAALSLQSSAQQLKVPAPSPGATIKQNFGLGELTIEYSRPGVKNRVIFGDVVPFGKMWRTGANSTTKITFTDDVKLDGHPVVAGTYGLYTIPNKESWDVMLTSDLSLGGNTADYKMDKEVLRFQVKPTALAAKVETFTIVFADVTATSTNVEIQWEKTKASFAVTTDIDSKVMKNIETALAEDKRPYFQAATYYYENDKDLKQALTWVNKAIETNKAFYVVHLKAKILLKMKDYKAAQEAAEQSMALAKEAKNDDYVHLNEKLIAEAKKGGK